MVRGKAAIPPPSGPSPSNQCRISTWSEISTPGGTRRTAAPRRKAALSSVKASTLESPPPRRSSPSGRSRASASTTPAGLERGIELPAHDPAVVEHEQARPGAGRGQHPVQLGRHGRPAGAGAMAVAVPARPRARPGGDVGVEVDLGHPAVAPDLLGLGGQAGGGEALSGGRAAGAEPIRPVQGGGGVRREATQGRLSFRNWVVMRAAGRAAAGSRSCIDASGPAEPARPPGRGPRRRRTRPRRTWPHRTWPRRTWPRFQRRRCPPRCWEGRPGRRGAP